MKVEDPLGGKNRKDDPRGRKKALGRRKGRNDLLNNVEQRTNYTYPYRDTVGKNERGSKQEGKKEKADLRTRADRGK